MKATGTVRPGPAEEEAREGRELRPGDTVEPAGRRIRGVAE